MVLVSGGRRKKTHIYLPKFMKMKEKSAVFVCNSRSHDDPASADICSLLIVAGYLYRIISKYQGIV